MRYAFLLLSLLLLSACSQPPSEVDADTEVAPDAATATASMDSSNDDFVEACLAKMNWERPLCECVEAEASERLSDDGYAFQIAVFRDDDDEAARLRERMPFEEVAQAGMFMVNASRECAEESDGS